MAINLESIICGKQKTPPKIFIYGVEGIGKSSWASKAPGSIFTNIEDRLAHIDSNKFPLAKTYDEVLEQIALLINEEHSFQTHITDSVDWLEKLIHGKICEENGEETITANQQGSPLAFGRGYVLAEELFRHYLAGLEKLRVSKNMAIIFTGHAHIKKFEDPMRDSYDHYIPAMNERISSTLKQWADCVFFCNYEVGVKKVEGSKTKKKAIAVGKRLIYTEKRPFFDAKNSYDMPFEIIMNKDKGFNTFLEYYSEWMTNPAPIKKTAPKKTTGKKTSSSKGTK